MEISSLFLPMDVQQRLLKYVSDRTPIAMYTTQDGSVDLGINTTSSRWAEGDMRILKDFYKAGILNLYDEVKFYQDTLTIINDRQFIVFEFKGIIREEESSLPSRSGLSKYIYIQYTLYNDSVLLFNFSAPHAVRSRWQEAANQMMNSIKIK